MPLDVIDPSLERLRRSVRNRRWLVNGLLAAVGIAWSVVLSSNRERGWPPPWPIVVGFVVAVAALLLIDRIDRRIRPAPIRRLRAAAVAAPDWRLVLDHPTSVTDWRKYGVMALVAIPAAAAAALVFGDLAAQLFVPFALLFGIVGVYVVYIPGQQAINDDRLAIDQSALSYCRPHRGETRTIAWPDITEIRTSGSTAEVATRAEAFSLPSAWRERLTGERVQLWEIVRTAVPARFEVRATGRRRTVLAGRAVQDRS